MADMIIVNSKFTGATFARAFKQLDARGIRPAGLYPAVSVYQFEKPRGFKPNYLSINRFERKKNIHLAIAVFARLTSLKGNLCSDSSLTIAGGFDKRLKENVEYLEELNNLAEREGVSAMVEFMASCSTVRRNHLLSECLCVIYTSKDEHFGIVPLEAMAAQKPVIACNSVGPIETINNGMTGFLCDPMPEEFASAMAKLIKDPHMAETMGKYARKHVEMISTKIFGQRLNQYILDSVRRKMD